MAELTPHSRTCSRITICGRLLPAVSGFDADLQLRLLRTRRHDARRGSARQDRPVARQARPAAGLTLLDMGAAGAPPCGGPSKASVNDRGASENARRVREFAVLTAALRADVGHMGAGAGMRGGDRPSPSSPREVYDRYIEYLTGCADMFQQGYIDVNPVHAAEVGCRIGVPDAPLNARVYGLRRVFARRRAVPKVRSHQYPYVIGCWSRRHGVTRKGQAGKYV